MTEHRFIGTEGYMLKTTALNNKVKPSANELKKLFFNLYGEELMQDIYEKEANISKLKYKVEQIKKY